MNPQQLRSSGQAWRSTVCFTRPGDRVNEDAVAATDHALIVVDGATGLDRAHVTGWPSDAQWFSHRLTALLAQRLEDLTTPIPEILRDCLHDLRGEFAQLAGSSTTTTATAAQGQPSASVIVVRALPTVLEVYSLGDCQAVIGHRDGGVSECHDSTVAGLDSAAIQEMVAWARREHTTNKNARAHVTDTLLRNRRSRNSPGGYWIADLSGVGVSHGTRWVLPRADVRDVALMTDGFTATQSLVHMVETPADLLRALRTTPAESIVQSLFAKLDDDPDYMTYPRLKHRDDSSVVHATLGP